MPIHDQGYRRYGGGKDARGQAWLVIARAGIRTMIARRLFLALLLVSWVRFFYECIRVYLTTNFGQFSVQAYARNLFDAYGVVSAGGFPTSVQPALGGTSIPLMTASTIRPRTIGVILGARF